MNWMTLKSEFLAQVANHPNFHRFLKEYLREFDLGVVVLVETRISGVKADKVIKNIACGFSRGIWILWKDTLKLPEINEWVYFTGVYGSLRWSIRKELWKELVTLTLCLVKMINKGFCDVSRLKDLGFKGQVFERIDRALGNSQWEMLMSDTTIYHLQRVKFDHRPLAIWCGKDRGRKLSRPFRFLSGWLSHNGFGQFKSPLKSLQKQQKSETEKSLIELESVLDNEELLWKQKSRSNWLTLGDRKTKRRVNQINALKLEDGMWCYEEEMLKYEAMSFYQRLYTEEKGNMGRFLVR
ncbi:hypothetical protein CXB51_020359 [Gossypium anomalum]|uniref:Uncharacterized protein n=1 Tax=Gossypium anomalum TaxID=47600 RepID=A0A8J5ZET7_9ROSI|nr:hypothetical protein CXB51_020359 [Gossypium anomalum]